MADFGIWEGREEGKEGGREGGRGMEVVNLYPLRFNTKVKLSCNFIFR